MFFLRKWNTSGKKDNVWITIPKYVPNLVATLRMMLVEVTQTKRAVASKNETVEALFNYLTGPEFANRVEAIMRGFIGMKEDLARKSVLHIAVGPSARSNSNWSWETPVECTAIFRGCSGHR